LADPFSTGPCYKSVLKGSLAPSRKRAEAFGDFGHRPMPRSVVVIEHLVRYLIENDMDTLYEERLYVVGFSFIRVYVPSVRVYLYQMSNDCILECVQTKDAKYGKYTCK